MRIAFLLLIVLAAQIASAESTSDSAKVSVTACNIFFTDDAETLTR